MRGLLPVFGCSNLTNLHQLRCLMSLATGALALMNKDEDITYL